MDADRARRAELEELQARLADRRRDLSDGERREHREACARLREEGARFDVERERLAAVADPTEAALVALERTAAAKLAELEAGAARDLERPLTAVLALTAAFGLASGTGWLVTHAPEWFPRSLPAALVGLPAFGLGWAVSLVTGRARPGPPSAFAKIVAQRHTIQSPWGRLLVGSAIAGVWLFLIASWLLEHCG